LKQKIGFNVAFVDSSLEQIEDDGKRVYKAFITLKRIHLFLLNENVTFLVGKLIVWVVVFLLHNVGADLIMG